MFKLMDKKIITILRLKYLLNWPYAYMSAHVLFNLLNELRKRDKMKTSQDSKFVIFYNHMDESSKFPIS